MNALVLGFAGCSGSGKSAVVETVASGLARSRVAVIDQDSYYRDQSHIGHDERMRVNVDTPEALDVELFASHLEDLVRGRSIEKPTYDFLTRTRTPSTLTVPSAEVILVEGLLLFHQPRLRALFDLKVFVDCPPDVRMVRRIRRDVIHRGRSLSHILDHYMDTGRSFHDEHIEPTKSFADIIISCQCDFSTSPAVGMIVGGAVRFLGGGSWAWPRPPVSGSEGPRRP